jgi:3D (Asp-Asp-Asp) domain-containing protein
VLQRRSSGGWQAGRRLNFSVAKPALDRYTSALFSKPKGKPNMKHHLFLLLIPLLFTVGCATQKAARTQKVRTTAYTHTEPGGRNSASGSRLSAGTIHSAAADWSRFPVGTRFKILQTGEICQIDDYGSALTGTNTIDLYKPSRGAMNRWGVRMVDIRILQWGSARRSLEILAPRAGNPHVRRMVAALRQQTKGAPPKFRKIES